MSTLDFLEFPFFSSLFSSRINKLSTRAVLPCGHVEGTGQLVLWLLEATSGLGAEQRGHEEALLMHLPSLWKVIEKIKVSKFQHHLTLMAC